MHSPRLKDDFWLPVSVWLIERHPAVLALYLKKRSTKYYYERQARINVSIVDIKSAHARYPRHGEYTITLVAT